MQQIHTQAWPSPTQAFPMCGMLLCPAMGPGQVNHVGSGQVSQARSSQTKSTPTHQQIGLLNRFLSAKVGQWSPGRQIWSVGIPPAPGEEVPVSRKSSSDSDGPRRDHRPSRGVSGGWRKETLIEFSRENLNRILHGSTDICYV